MNTLSLVLVSASMISAGFSDFLYKRAQIRGVQPLSFIAVQAAAGNVAVIAMAWYFGVEVSVTSVLYAVACAYAMLPAMVFLLRSLRHGDASVNVPIYRLSFILTAVGAVVLLRESIYPGKVLAIVLAALSVLTLSSIWTGGSARLSKGLGSLLAATLCYGVYGVLSKAAMQEGISPMSILVVQGPLNFLTVTGIVLARGGAKVDSTVLRTAPWCGLLLTVAVFLLLLSLQLGEASVNVPIVQLSFVFTAVLAVILLREPLTKKLAIGIVLAILAVVVFALR